MTDVQLILDRLGEIQRNLGELGRRLQVLEHRTTAPTDWLTADEAAAAYRVSRSWLYRSGISRRRVGRRTLWHRSGLEAMVRGRVT